MVYLAQSRLYMQTTLQQEVGTKQEADDTQQNGAQAGYHVHVRAAHFHDSRNEIKIGNRQERNKATVQFSRFDTKKPCKLFILFLFLFFLELIMAVRVCLCSTCSTK